METAAVAAQSDCSADSGRNPFKGVLQHLARATKVEPHETLALKETTVRQTNPRGIEETHSVLLAKPSRINPSQVGAFDVRDTQLRQLPEK